MDQRDRVIIPQVAFKGAIDMERETDLATPDGQARFEAVFSYLNQSLMNAVRSGQSGEDQMAEVIRGQFPGTTNVGASTVMSGGVPIANVQPQPPSNGVRIKGTQHGPLPDWLFEEAAEAGVTEVYDNRDRAAGTKRPWFRATTGGDDAKAFWPPRT